MARQDLAWSAQLLKQPTILMVDIPEGAMALSVKGRLDVLDFTQAGPKVRDVDGHIFTLSLPPMMLTGILADDTRGTNAQRLVSWLEAAGARIPPILEWRRGTEVESLEAVTQWLGQMVAQGAARRAHTTEEVIRMRSANAELHYRFAVAEDALLRSGAMPFELAFVNEPAADVAQHVLLSETEAGIAQVLPLGSAGVSGIGIHFGPAVDAGPATLLAQLSTKEDGKVIERWTIGSDRITEGWNVLGLGRTISGLSRTLELQLTRQSPDERLPPISLGTGQSLIAYQIRDVASGQPALRNSLALQVWTSVPGTRSSGRINVHLPEQRRSRSGGFTDIPMAPAALTTAEHANPEQVQFDFPAVVGPPGERAVMCHAPVFGMTLGRLGGSVPADAIRVSASAFIDNQQSKDVDFALIVTNSADRARAIGEGVAETDASEAFSGWCQVGNGEVKRLSAMRETAATGASLFVATRMSVAGDNSYARARFKDFSVMVQA